MGEVIGKCQVLAWRASDEPSRSAPGTRHVCLSLKLRTPQGTTRTAKVWWTPEHPNEHARKSALELGSRLGLTERKCSARRLASALDLNPPGEVEAFVDEKGFWRITW